jgi:hypothetical protein
MEGNQKGEKAKCLALIKFQNEISTFVTEPKIGHKWVTAIKCMYREPSNARK